MPAATIIAILQALAVLLPQIPEIIQGIQTAISLLESGRDPTPAEQASIDALLDAAHKALQAS